MGRIRSIKPELPQSENLGRCSRDARYLFILLWTICDDSGTARGASRMLASLLFPYDDDAPELIDGWLAEIEREGCISRYVVNGTQYLRVHNWLNHQRIDRPTPSKLPQFDESSRVLASIPRVLGDGLEGKGRERDNRKGKEKEHVPPPKIAASRFAEFWSVYPIKRGKKTAHAKWVSKRLDERADELITDVQKRIASDEQWLRGFAPHASTYLQQERWEDELKGRREPAPQPSKTMNKLTTLQRMKDGNRHNPQSDIDLEPASAIGLPELGRNTRR